MCMAGICWSGEFCVPKGKYDQGLQSELRLHVVFVVVVVLLFFFCKEVR